MRAVYARRFDAVHLAAGHRGLLAARHALNGFLVASGPFATIITRALVTRTVRADGKHASITTRSHSVDLRSDVRIFVHVYASACNVSSSLRQLFSRYANNEQDDDGGDAREVLFTPDPAETFALRRPR